MGDHHFKNATTAHRIGVLGHGCVLFTAADPVQRQRRAVQPDDEHMPRLARRHQPADLAQRRNDAAHHFVVMAEHANDVGILRERIQHHLVGIVRRPFGVQRAHLDIRKGRSHLIVEALVAGLRLRRADRAAGFKHHALAADHRAQSIRTLRAPGDIVEIDKADEIALGRGVFHDEHRNSGLVGTLDARHQQGRVNGIDHDGIGLLGDGIQGLRHLQIGVALAVDDVQDDSRFFGTFFHALDHRHLIFVLQAKGDVFHGLAPGVTLGSKGRGTKPGQPQQRSRRTEQNHPACQCSQFHSFLHLIVVPSWVRFRGLRVERRIFRLLRSFAQDWPFRVGGALSAASRVWAASRDCAFSRRVVMVRRRSPDSTRLRR